MNKGKNTATEKTYLSIVVTGRNDDYGNDFNDRLQNFISWTSLLIEKYNILSEIILINYNPIKTKPSLYEKLNWPTNNKYLSIRIITIPEEIHKNYIDPKIRKTVPLFEFPAKNVGIRRAKGEIILSTNADILFHPKIFHYIAKGMIQSKSYYRTDRFDYNKIQSNEINNINSYLKEIKANVFKIYLKAFAYKFKNGAISKFKIKKKQIYNRFKIRLYLYLISLAKSMKIIPYFRTYDHLVLTYHTHCSGDFMLMHKKHWLNLQGYPENTYISTHTDAIFTVMAASLGLKEIILKLPVYHQDHQRRYDQHDNPNDKDSRNMLLQFYRDSKQMESSEKPIIYNDSNWGWGNLSFEEITI
tara:strand:- start:9496 stop:10569 length:1074 start_codon:yes stop_codon:yes gene_type:complete